MRESAVLPELRDPRLGRRMSARTEGQPQAGEDGVRRRALTQTDGAADHGKSDAGQRRTLALLMIEDVTELLSLRALIPICMMCKKIRDDEQYWHEVEEYFHDQIGVDFSHGLCPACVKKFNGENYKYQPVSG